VPIETSQSAQEEDPAQANEGDALYHAHPVVTRFRKADLIMSEASKELPPGQSEGPAPRRPLPWAVNRAHDDWGEEKGIPERRTPTQLVDANGVLICEFTSFDAEDGALEALAICTAINRAGAKICSSCGAKATCFGAYENGTQPAYACDDCCGHGCEDGYCELLDPCRENGS
jgi:hypothetical protein